MASNLFPLDVHWSFHPAGDFLAFDSGAFQARIHKDSGHFALAGPDLRNRALANMIQFAPPAVQTADGSFPIGRIISSKNLPNGLELNQDLNGAPVTTQITFTHEGVMRYEVTNWSNTGPLATAVAAASDNQEHFYGFGEKFNSLDQAGKKVHTLTFDNPGNKGDRSYKVAPWFISTRGYGVHLDSTAESSLDMRAGAPDRYVVTNPIGRLSLNVVYGPLLTDVLSRYTEYSGRPALPPPWAFGPWISSDVWRSGGDVRYAVTQFRRRGIPVSGFVFDSPWETAYNDFNFNMTQFGKDATIDGEHHDGFSSVSEMMTFLQTNGLKVICWMTPFVNQSSDNEGVAGQNLGKASNYDEGANAGFFVRSPGGDAPLLVPWWKGKGSPVDFTNPAARRWLSNQLDTLVAQSSVAVASGAKEPAIGGFKTDDGESGNGPNTYIPLHAAYADGRTGVEMRNGYCLEYHKTIWNVLGNDGILFARSGFAGSQAFPGYWAGDNEPNFGDNGLPGVIVAGQSAAMSGYSIWGHDTGGYQDSNFSKSPPNLFMRWTQFGCFSPIMQMHRQVTRELQYPWRYGDQAAANYQFFARLHTQLFPYIYTYAKLANITGLPIIRPLVLLNQTDPNTFGVKHAYHFGNEFLVAPMIAPDADSRELYLPADTWIDFWSNQRHAGGQNITWTNTDQSKMPVFVRDGAIIPMLLTEADTLCDANYTNNSEVISSNSDLLFRIYPGGASRFVVHDGTDIQCNAGANSTTIAISSIARTIVLQVLAAVPQRVTRDGAELTRFFTGAELDLAAEGWRFDFSSGFVFIKFEHSGAQTEVIL
jgi:alpha-D-xyloside xylohydrolase